jgi:hypothetical protein
MNPAHPLAPEEVMAYLDGQVIDEDARRIQAHLATCDGCQQLAAELREGSRQMRSWQIEGPPPSLVPPPAPRRASATPVRADFGFRAWSFVTGHRLLAGAAVAVLILVPLVMRPAREMAIGLSGMSLTEKAESIEPEIQYNRLSRQASAPQSIERAQGLQGNTVPDPLAGGGPRIVRTATVRIVAAGFDRVRPAIDRILQTVSGFTGELTASDRPGTPRSIRGTLRIPSAQLDDALMALRGLGRVIEESQRAEDVTASVVDLNVRLTNARVTERRLSEVLRNRTGGVADVLEVEREIARVRTDIEQMEAQRQQLERRVEYATVTLEISEERAAAVNLGPVPIPTRLRHAIADGVESAAMSMLEATLFVLRRGPALLLWLIVVGLPAWLVIRRHPLHASQRPGGV